MPGDSLPRAAVHELVGGRPKGRISPSRQGHVLLFLRSDLQGHEYEGWTGTHVQVLGEGGDGGTDQQLSRGNGALLNHREEGRSVRLFTTEEEVVRYHGEFEVDADLPWIRTRLPEVPTQRSGSGRLAFVFRLLPVGDAPTGLPSVSGAVSSTQLRPVPALPVRLNLDAKEQAAASLLRAYAIHQARSRTPRPGFTGWHISEPGNLAPLEIDLFDEVNRELIIAAPSTVTNELHLSFGELLDLQVFFTPRPKMVLVLPARPEDRLAELFEEHRVTVTWPQGSGFARAEPS